MCDDDGDGAEKDEEDGCIFRRIGVSRNALTPVWVELDEVVVVLSVDKCV